jgi:hypothetical protein
VGAGLADHIDGIGGDRDDLEAALLGTPTMSARTSGSSSPTTTRTDMAQRYAILAPCP